MKYLEHIGREELASKFTKYKLDAVNEKEFKLTPIGKFLNLSNTNDRQTYGYDYQTLILLSIEKEIGKDKMQQWIRLLLKENVPTADFNFLKTTLKEAIQNDKLFNHVLDTYLLSSKSVKNINKIMK